jgi:C_GCAxxG_C_C family probable redox protein
MDDSTRSDAIYRFRNGSNCAQAVLSAYFLVLGYDESLAHRMGAGLGGGIGRKQYICGAVNAGAIVLSLVHGNQDRANTVQKETATAIVREFIEEFENEFHTSQCRELVGLDTSTPEGRQQAAAAGISESVCVPCITRVCELVDKKVSIRSNGSIM